VASTTPRPLITIGITCYNAAGTIGRAVDSALRQDWTKFEVIVVDDCSSDGSREVVARRQHDDDRIRLMCHDTNRGPGAARQTILEAAKGVFVAFFDDDDESAVDRLSTQCARIMAYERETGAQLVACYASGCRVYSNGYALDIDAIGSRPIVPEGHLVADYLLFNGRREHVFYGGGTPACALMARVETLRAAGGFDATMRRVEDADIAARLAFLGAHFIGCPERLYTQYATEGADKSAQRNYQAGLTLITKHRDYLERKWRYDYARDWFAMRYYHFSGQRPRMVLALIALWLRHPIWVTRHALMTIPARIRHERRMRRPG